MIAVGPIAREEFAARVARVRERMVESGLDALVCYGAHVDYAPGDLRYLADWFCIEEEQALLIVPADGPVTLLTDSSADVDRAREQAVCDEVVLAGDLGAAAAARLRGCSTAGLTGMRLLPAAAMDALRAGAPASGWMTHRRSPPACGCSRARPRSRSWPRPPVSPTWGWRRASRP